MKRFKYPLEGFLYLFKKDNHFVMHFSASVLVIILSIYLRLNLTEWLFILSAIFSVFIVEAINTAVEDVVDLFTREFHPLAKTAKDVASFAVLLASIYAFLIGLVIFLPKLINFL